MVKNNSYSSWLGLPKSPSFFYSALSSIHVCHFYKTHGVGSGPNKLNDVINDFATFTVPVSRESLVRAKLGDIRIGTYKIGKSSFSVGSESCCTGGIRRLKGHRPKVKSISRVNDCRGKFLGCLITSTLVLLTYGYKGIAPSLLSGEDFFE